MTEKTKEETQIYLEMFLPDAIEKFLGSYQSFLSNKGSKKTAEFLEFHKACKAAISNVEQLLKLYKWIETHGENIPQSENIEKLIEESRARLKSYENNDFLTL